MGNYGLMDLGSAPPFLTRNVTTKNIAKALDKEEFAKVYRHLSSQGLGFRV